MSGPAPSPAGGGPGSRLVGRLRRRGEAVGALASQVVIALGSLLLQLLASRSLGAEGLGVFAFLFGAIVMATAVSTGLVGDSLTVLDRSDPAVRAGLWRTAWVTVGAATLLALGGALLSPDAGPGVAAGFAAATAAFMLADLARRLLIAHLRFWTLVALDLGALTVSMLVLAVCSLAGTLRLEHFLLALALGQLTTLLLALTRLPEAERGPRPRGAGDWRAVVGYGGWRATQQFVRPTMLNLARWLVLLAAGAAAVGAVEMARIVVAPAMLLVQGVGSYLFASYARDKGRPIGALRARADRAAAVMLAGAAVIGAATVVVLPLVEDVVTGGAFELSAVAVAGWACYAASCAAVMPYGSLAAVRGRQRWVLVLRVVDSAVSLALVAALVLGAGLDVGAMPWLLSVGSFVGGLLCRQLLLGDPAETTTEAAAPSAPPTDGQEVGREAHADPARRGTLAP